MKKSRKLLSLVLCVCLLITLVGLIGCGNTSPEEQPGQQDDQNQGEKSKDDAKKPVELKIWWAEGDQFKAILLDAILAYKDVNPHVKIVPQWQPNFDTYDKLKVAIAGKTAPDITKLDSVFAPALGFKGQLVDLTQFGANDIKDKFIESTWKAGMYKEQVYALPFDANTIAFFYNKDILDKAGKEPPKTYEEIIEVGKAIEALNLPDTYAYTVPVTSGTSGWLAFQWNFWLWRNGGEVLNEDWTKAVYNSPEGVEALQKVVDLVHKHEVVPPNVYLEPEFYDGNVGMLDMGCWNVPVITGEDAQANFGITTMPALKDGVPGHSGLGLYSIGVLTSCKAQQEAYEFVKFLATNKEYQVTYSKKTNLMPSLVEAYEDEYFKTPAWEAFLAQLKIAKARPGTPAWPEIAEHMNIAIQEALTGKKTAQEALDGAVAKSNEALAKVK